MLIVIFTLMGHSQKKKRKFAWIPELYALHLWDFWYSFTNLKIHYVKITNILGLLSDVEPTSNFILITLKWLQKVNNFGRTY